MGLFPLFPPKDGKAAPPVQAASTPDATPQPKSAVDLMKSEYGSKPGKPDDYDFEDIEETKMRRGIKPRTTKRIVGHTWGEIAVGTAQSCMTMGAFGALMGLSVGAITVTIALMKKQSLWFGVIFGGGGGIVGAVRKYA
ncbi:hypothetical protein T484DRAFT_1960437 [Baffinella frigidus]|nr:hypothetical protein T484DRAFT_1960437 [Cryptophyta sp. CCMP2293]